MDEKAKYRLVRSKIKQFYSLPWMTIESPCLDKDERIINVYSHLFGGEGPFHEVDRETFITLDHPFDWYIGREVEVVTLAHRDRTMRAWDLDLFSAAGVRLTKNSSQTGRPVVIADFTNRERKEFQQEARRLLYSKV